MKMTFLFRSMTATTCALMVFALVRVGEASEAETWLMRLNEAAATRSFMGDFVYFHGDGVEAMRVIRRVRDGMLQERLYALNGEAREIVRDEDRLWCFIPGKNVGVRDYRQKLESGFPLKLPANLGTLRQHYRFEIGESSRIADRVAQKIEIIPEDYYRYGYSLWADFQTGLLLRSDLLDESGQLIERYMFVDIEIDPQIKDEDLEPSTSMEGLTWYGMDMPKTDSRVRSSAWRVDSLPAGYRLSEHMRRVNPMNMEEEEHMVFTDGLSSVSVFVKPLGAEQGGMEGPSRMGSVHAYRVLFDNHRVTVMGEVPHHTVEYLAKGITLQH